MVAPPDSDGARSKAAHIALVLFVGLYIVVFLLKLLSLAEIPSGDSALVNVAVYGTLLLLGAGLVAPEMQITQESSVAGYADYLDRFVGGTSIYIVGLGDMIPHPDGERHSGGRAREIKFNIEPLIAKAKDVNQLLDEINVLFLNGQMQSDTRAIIHRAVSEAVPKRNNDDMRRVYRERVSLALYLALLSTDYLVLK